MDRIILHLDVNNAFLSWTAIDLLKNGYKYDIRDKEAVIGGDESRRAGIVLAKSIKAKQKGIVTGETVYNARKKCPRLEIYPPQFKVYQEMSNKLFKLLSKYTPDIEVFSIDECFIDYGKVKRLYGNEVTLANKLKDEIYNTLGFTVNIGIGNNKLCAKMASDFQKPNLVHTLYLDEVQTKMWPLPINDLFGIGKKTAAKLNEININTIGELAKTNLNELAKYFKTQASYMIERANGIDYAEVVTISPESKGISTETTLDHDLRTKGEIYKVLNRISEKLAAILRTQERYAHVVVVYYKDKYFNTSSHQRKLKNATNITNEIFEVSKKLLNELWHNEPVRLVGIRLDDLVREPVHQLSLFENINERHDVSKLEKTVDKLNAKYGKNIIKKLYIDKNT